MSVPPTTSSQSPLEDERLRDLYVRTFETLIARDKTDLAEVHRLRYQVYCVENPFEDPADNPDGLERDPYDHRATHCLLLHRPSGNPVGTVRLVLPDTKAPEKSFALQDVCIDPLVRDPRAFPLARMAEVSRFCVSKEFRRRCNDGAYGRVEDQEGRDPTRRLIPHLTLGLIEGLVRMSMEQGIRTWCAVMEPTLLRLLKRLGIHFENIGPLVDYHGRRQPCYQHLDRFLERVREERPEIWEVLTDDGRHWEALQVQWGGLVDA